MLVLYARLSPTDLQSTDRHSDTFLRKINRARFALARTDSIRSVSYSVYAKVPYRRAASVPMHLLTKTLPKNATVKGNHVSPPFSWSAQTRKSCYHQQVLCLLFDFKDIFSYLVSVW